MPLELITIASYIKDDYDVKIIDPTAFKDIRQMRHAILKELDNNVLCVGITVITQAILKAISISNLIKQFVDVPIVWGGIHPSLRPEESLENK